MIADYEGACEAVAKLVQACEQKLSPFDFENMTSLVDHNEPVIAFENLCTQLFEYDKSISAATKTQFAEVGTFFEIESDYWEDLAIDDS